MPTDPYTDDEQKKPKKKRGGQGNKGRQPGKSGPPKGDRVKPPAPGPGTKDTTKAKGGDIGGKLAAAATIAKTIADMSPSKHHGPIMDTNPVKANDEPPKGMDLSVGKFDNKSPLPDDDLDYQKKKKMYGL